MASSAEQPEETGWRQLAPIILVLGAVTTGGLVLASPVQPVVHTHLFLVLAICFVLFIASEYAKVHIEVRRHALSVSWSDLPLLFGLFSVPLDWLLAVRLLAGVVSLATRSRERAKGLFNLSLFSAEVAVAGVVGGLLPGELLHGDPGTSQWVNSLIVVLAIDLLGVVSVVWAISRLSGWPTVPAIALMVVSLLVSGGMCAGLASLSLIAVSAGPAGYWLLLGMASLGLLAYRSYSRLMLHHADLNRVIDASQRVVAAGSRGELMSRLRREAAGVVQAEAAEIWPVHAHTDPVLPPSGMLPMVVRADIGSAAQRAWLRERGFREALVVPVETQRRRGSVLVVHNRLSGIASFSVDDLRLVQTLVSHATAVMTTLQLSEQLAFDMRHDRLTGLPNRDALVERLRGLTLRAGTFATLLVLDLDRFTEVNDALGHTSGDEVLVQAAQRVRAALTADEMPEDAMAFRVDGDEFAVLLPQVSDPTAVDVCLERLHQSFNHPFAVSGTVIGVSASVGLARADPYTGDPGQLLRQAQIALARAKAVEAASQWYSPQLQTTGTQRVTLAAELRRVVAQDRLDLEFAQVVRLRTDRGTTDDRVQFEAVPTWEHPLLGTLRAERFWAAAAEAGDTTPLALHVLHKALQACALWSDRTVLRVALPGRVLTDPQAVNQLSVWTAQYGVNPSRVVLGVDEGALLEEAAADPHTHPERATPALHQLRALGFRLYVLDFGSGQSSLSQLGSLPVAGVRVAPSFTRELLTSVRAKAVVSSIVSVAHAFELSVTVAGVDSPELLSVVVDLGCDLAEGDAVGLPVAPDQVVPQPQTISLPRSVDSVQSLD